MRRRLKGNGSVIVLLGFLVFITSIATYQELRQTTDFPALSSLSSEPQGTRALLLWLEALDYVTSPEAMERFEVPPETEMALVLEPQLPGVSTEEWQSLEEWVESGGVLFLIGEGFGAAVTMQHVDFDIAYREDLTGAIDHIDKSLGIDTADARATLSNLQARAVLQSEGTDYTPLLSIDGELVAARIGLGNGAVILSTLAYPMTNEGLKAPGNALFVLRLLTLAPERGNVWFDEWHHGQRVSATGSQTGIGYWLRATRPGQAILYSAAVLFFWLVLSGSKFGRSVPLQGSTRRRASAEHAVALASLSRQAGHREVVREHLRRTVKQRFGNRYGLPAALPDDQFVKRLSAAHPELDKHRLSSVLEALNRDDTSEEHLLKLAQEINEWTTS